MRISRQVENILAASHAARNSDRELLIIYMQKFGMELTDKQIGTFRQMPSVETIRRTRQQLQMQGKYPADKKVDEERFNKYQQMKHGVKHETPEVLLEQRGYKILDWGH